MFQFTGPSTRQLSSLNLLFKVTSVLYPEGMEEQMQLVKSGFNSPASFNFLPCLLINESALEALGIPWFFHIQENSTQWLNSQGLEQAVSLSFEAASLWISLPQQQLQTLSSPWQLHLISSQGCWHRAGMSHYPLLACVPFPPEVLSFKVFSPRPCFAAPHGSFWKLCCVRHSAGALSPPRAGAAEPGTGSFPRALRVSPPGVPSPRTVASSQLSGALRHCLRLSGLSGSASERVSGTFALFKQISSALGFSWAPVSSRQCCSVVESACVTTLGGRKAAFTC